MCLLLLFRLGSNNGTKLHGNAKWGTKRIRHAHTFIKKIVYIINTLFVWMLMCVCVWRKLKLKIIYNYRLVREKIKHTTNEKKIGRKERARMMMFLVLLGWWYVYMCEWDKCAYVCVFIEEGWIGGGVSVQRWKYRKRKLEGRIDVCVCVMVWFDLIHVYMCVCVSVYE